MVMADTRPSDKYTYGAQAKAFGKKIARPVTNAYERKKNGGVTNAEIEQYGNPTPKTLIRGSAEWNARMSEFENHIAELDHNMYLEIKKHDKWVKGKEREQMIEENRYYNYQLMHMCTMPLAQGISADSIVECLSMYVGCMIVSPAFRAQAMQGMKESHVKRLTESAERLEKTIDKLETANIGAIRMGAQGNEWLAGAGAAFAKTKLGQAYNNTAFGKAHTIDGTHSARSAAFYQDLADSMATAHENKSNNLGTRFKKYVEKSANYGVEPLNPNIYSMHVIDLQVSAYKAMRQPGADFDAIEKDLQTAINALNTRAYGEKLFTDEAGLEALARNTRHMTQELMLKDPELQFVFQETAYGEYDERDPKTNEIKYTHKLYHQRDSDSMLDRDRDSLSNEELKHEYHEVFMGDDYDRKHFDGSFYVGTVKNVERTREVPDPNNPGGKIKERFIVEEADTVPFTGLFHVRRPEMDVNRLAAMMDDQIISNIMDSSDPVDYMEQMSDWHNLHSPSFKEPEDLGDPIEKSEGVKKFEKMYTVAEQCAAEDAGYMLDPATDKPYVDAMDAMSSLRSRVMAIEQAIFDERSESAATCHKKMEHNKDVIGRKAADAKAWKDGSRIGDDVSSTHDKTVDITETEREDYNWIQRGMQKMAAFKERMKDFTKSADKTSPAPAPAGKTKHRGEDEFPEYDMEDIIDAEYHDASADYQS